MNRLRGFVTVLIVAGLVGSGIAYHLNVVKEYNTTLEVVAKTATLENLTLASENQQLQSGTEDLLLIMKRSFIVAEAFAQAGVTSYEEVEEILNKMAALRVEYVAAGEEVPPVIDDLIALLRRVRDRLLDIFIEPMPVPDIPDTPLPDEDRVTNGSFDGIIVCESVSYLESYGSIL